MLVAELGSKVLLLEKESRLNQVELVSSQAPLLKTLDELLTSLIKVLLELIYRPFYEFLRMKEMRRKNWLNKLRSLLNYSNKLLINFASNKCKREFEF